MTYPNAHVTLSVWEAISRLSQLICCHTQHCHFWTDIMKCTLIQTLAPLLIHLTIFLVKSNMLDHISHLVSI